jgi:hypothetical protein
LVSSLSAKDFGPANFVVDPRLRSTDLYHEMKDDKEGSELDVPLENPGWEKYA